MLKWLKTCREHKNMTMFQVSSECNIAESFYCQIENGKRMPSVATAKKIARLLGFDWTEFFVDTQKDGGDTTNEPDGSTEKAI